CTLTPASPASYPVLLGGVRHRPRTRLVPYTTLFRSEGGMEEDLVEQPERTAQQGDPQAHRRRRHLPQPRRGDQTRRRGARRTARSEEHTSELQSRFDLVCRLLLEKRNSTTLTSRRGP